jgi:peroxiredoxin
MTTRSPFSRPTWTLTVAPIALLAAACAPAQTPSKFPLLKSCGEGSETVAAIGGSDEVKIRYSFAADSGTCYAVTATVDGKDVNGYLAGPTHSAAGATYSISSPVHPAIIAFEQEIRMHVVQIPVPAPAPPTALKPAASETAATRPTASLSTPPQTTSPQAVTPNEPVQDPPPPLSFAGFRAVDIKGNRVDFSAMRTPNIVIYFWSATDKRGIKKAGQMETIYDEFHTRGVDVVGVASARNATQLRQVCSDNEVVWPEILDAGGIANRYHVDPAKPYILLDRSRKVIAAATSPAELAAVLRPLTKTRRVIQ